MALGFTTSNRDFLPIIKYDARAGKFFKITRTQGEDGKWTTTQDEIASPIVAMNIADVEVGWLSFASGAPNFHMSHNRDGMPPRPSEDHKEAFRVLIKMSEKEGGEVRHFSHSAQCVLIAFDQLHDLFLEAPESKDMSKCPVIGVNRTEAIKGSQGSTNYAPVFQIVKWIDRPAEFDDHPVQGVPKGDAAAAAWESKASEAAAPVDDEDVPF